MKLYLDEDSIASSLVGLLRKKRHDVQVPSEVGMAGSADAEQFIHAIRAGRVTLTGNDKDFRRLHLLILEASGHHPGIVIVRYDNDAHRDMTPRGIAAALAKLEAAQPDLSNALVVLNQWR